MRMFLLLRNFDDNSRAENRLDFSTAVLFIVDIRHHTLYWQAIPVTENNLRRRCNDEIPFLKFSPRHAIIKYINLLRVWPCRQ